MKSKKSQIVVVVILSCAIVLTLIGIMASFYIPTGKKGVMSIGIEAVEVTDDYAEDVELGGFVANSSSLQQ